MLEARIAALRSDCLIITGTWFRGSNEYCYILSYSLRRSPLSSWHSFDWALSARSNNVLLSDKFHQRRLPAARFSINEIRSVDIRPAKVACKVIPSGRLRRAPENPLKGLLICKGHLKSPEHLAKIKLCQGSSFPVLGKLFAQCIDLLQTSSDLLLNSI
jgi:hypothetical protein